MEMKSIIVSGATGYFGKYFVSALSEIYHVIAMGRDLKKLQEQFPDNKNIHFVAVDLYDCEKLTAVLEDLCLKFSIYGLINNAYDFSKQTGFNSPDGRYEDLPLSKMKAGIESGILAPMIFCQIVGNQMIQKKIQGSIINIASMYGTVAPDYRLYEGKTAFNPVTYSVSKAALNALTRYIASFWGPYGIRCNSVAPGAFPNIETNSCNAPPDEEFLKRLRDKTTLGRFGHPNDLLGIVKLLLSNDASYITGQIIGVDGGWTVI